MKDREIKKVIKWIENDEKEKLLSYFRNKLKVPVENNDICPSYVKERAEEFRKKLIKKQTKAEVTFKAYLKSHGIKYDFQKIIYCRDKNKYKCFYIADFYLPEGDIVIEIDGSSHDGKEEEDKLRTLQLKKNSVRSVFRFTNEEIFKKSDYINDRLRMIKKEIIKNCQKALKV